MSGFGILSAVDCNRDPRPAIKITASAILLMPPLNPVIHLQSPNPYPLRQKPENKRRDFGLKNIADSDARRRIRRIDHVKNMLCDQLWRRRVLHISIDRGPRFRDSHFVAWIMLAAFDYRVVECRRNVRGLKIDNADVTVWQLKLD